jgi:tRNA dimethylallyltransferase
MIVGPSANALSNNNLSSKFPILIAGPTGVGKSAFAVALAQRVGGEILCADAFQLYAGLAVLTAQPPVAEQRGVPHHLYGSVDPARNIDAALFLRLVEPLVQEILARDHFPLLVGGTGLYLKAFTHGLDEMPPVDAALRARLSSTPLPELQELLHAHDPEAARQTDLQNPRRVQRALEIVLTSGKPLSASRQAWQTAPRRFYRALYLQRSPEDLDHRIRRNVANILSSGAPDEVRTLDQRPLGETAVRAIGFTTIRRWQAGEITRPACEEQMFRQTRQYAKRQRTWFARQTDYHPVPLRPAASPEESCRGLADELCQQHASGGSCS